MEGRTLSAMVMVRVVWMRWGRCSVFCREAIGVRKSIERGEEEDEGVSGDARG